jgi:hypothetical protein
MRNENNFRMAVLAVLIALFLHAYAKANRNFIFNSALQNFLRIK